MTFIALFIILYFFAGFVQGKLVPTFSREDFNRLHFSKLNSKENKLVNFYVSSPQFSLKVKLVSLSGSNEKNICYSTVTCKVSLNRPQHCGLGPNVN